MSEVKQLLKEAKIELSRADYEEAAAISEQVLKLDPENYFAQVFLGKSYSCIENKMKDAVSHYVAATDLLPNNMLAWKGFFILLNSEGVVPSTVSFDDYFNLCGKYAETLIQNELPLVELIHELRVMKKKFPQSHESFYRHMRPGTPMAERLGRHLITPQDALKGLITIINDRELESIAKIVSRERLRLSTNDPDYQIKINALAWEVFNTSELDDLYNQLINILDDDDTRAKYESLWLEYRIRVLKSMPIDLKLNFFFKVKNMVEDMVLVDHGSLLVWSLYFEWHDYEDLDKMDKNLILKFFKKFPTEPLAMILYAWICSSFSKYDISEFDNNDKKNEKTETIRESETETEDDELNELVENEEEDSQTLKEDDILIALNDNISKAQNNALAHRIISQYYIFSKEYEAALPYIKKGISLVSHKIRDLGCQLIHTKREFSLTLATCYTYVDAPQFHNAAMTLFDRILQESPDNTRAKMGKGIIYIERENWQDANKLLKEVINEYPDNLDVLSELGWTKANLGQYDEAIEMLSSALRMITGNDLRTTTFRALTLWRQAKSYIFKEAANVSQGLENIKLAFKILVQLIKVLDTYAPAYSTLGDLYTTYYKDSGRAFKCYYKAFELDAGDHIAANYMTEVYAKSNNWSSAVQIAERLVKAEKAKRVLQTMNWPYRVIGIGNLERQQESDSIEWFQSAIRVDPNDVESWIGLGQAYLGCGRIEASFHKSI